MPQHRSTADKLQEAVSLLEHVAHREGYVVHREGDSVERLVMLARSIAFRWPADDAPTAKLPPVRERILPPLPGVRELKGAELLRALADAMDEDPDVDGESL